MERDSSIVQSTLGYKYNPEKDTLQISNMEVDHSVNTKRRVVPNSECFWSLVSVHSCYGQSKRCYCENYGLESWAGMMWFLQLYKKAGPFWQETWWT